jgi:uncharacterized membrane protein
MLENLKRDKSGFRLRGTEMSRIETFTDAAFAFALTLLVVSLSPPSTFDKLIEALTAVPAFLLSATMLMMFWWGHHEWSRRYGLDDSRTLVLSCALVFTVLVYVYPLRFMFALMVTWFGRLGGVPLNGGATIRDVGDVNRLFALYGVGFTAMSAAILLLYVHAWSRRDDLELDDNERFITRSTIGAWGILASAGILSTITSLLIPAHWPGAAGWIYALLGPLMPLYGARMRRLQARRTAPAGLGALHADV